MSGLRPGRTGILLAAAGVSVAAGLALSVGAVAQAREARARARAMQRVYGAVAEAAADIRLSQSVGSAFTPEESRPETPATVHRRWFPDRAPEFVDVAPPLNTPAGRLRKREWLFDDAPVDRVLAFAAACEAARPPWRVESLRITSLPGTEGRVRGGLQLIGIDP